MKIVRKIIDLIKQIRCIFSSSYAEKYYSWKYRKEILVCHPSAIFKGPLKISDSGNLVIGKNVTVSAHCRFISEGGIYLQDGAHIGKNVLISTIQDSFVFERLNSTELNRLYPVVINPMESVCDNTKIKFKKLEFTIFRSKTSFTPNFFVVSTGRSGTKAISTYLNQHDLISCQHEAKFQLNRISTEYAHGFKSAKEILYELEVLYWGITCDPTGKKIIGECDLKNSNLIPFLHQINPDAKFIWLTRRADDFVASAYGRRWFDEYEYTFPFPEKSPDTSDDFSLFNKYRMEYSRYRVNGNLAGVFTLEEWKSMNCFERCCWYWNWWNSQIESDLNSIPEFQSIHVRLESLKDKQSELFDFLSVKPLEKEFRQVNQAYHITIPRASWSTNQIEQYEKWCSTLMQRWYGV